MKVIPVFVLVSFATLSKCLSDQGAVYNDQGIPQALPSVSPSANPPLMEIVQPAPPVLGPDERYGARKCSLTLMNHTFGNSEGRPFQTTLTESCGNDWDIVSFNLSFVSYGRQYDRLGTVWLGNTEVWRFCTAEPVWYGIHFSYEKDMTAYKALIKDGQEITVDLVNYIVDVYNGSFSGVLTVNYYKLGKSPDSTVADRPRPADDILSISNNPTMSKHYPSVFSLPNDKGEKKYTLARNVERALVEIFASGDSREEFWPSNVPEEYAQTFQGEELLGKGNFREVQVFIDGNLAGVVWPFTIVFTGGIVPGFWRPIVGIHTFNLPRHYVDITLFLPLIRDGKEHSFRFRIRGQPDTHQRWLVSGNIQLWYGQTDAQDNNFNQEYTIENHGSDLEISTTGHFNVLNTSLTVTTNAIRRLLLRPGTPSSSSSSSSSSSLSLSVRPFFEQTLRSFNRQIINLTANGRFLQSTIHETEFKIRSSYGLIDQGLFRMDLDSSQQIFENGNITLAGTLGHLYNRLTGIQPRITENERTLLNATGGYFANASRAAWGWGRTSEDMKWEGKGRRYHRKLSGENGTFTRDHVEET